jgi:putative addiction module component (TIGR02574 family)
MTKTSRDLFEQVLALPPIDRAALVEEIYRSLGKEEDGELTRAWVAEAEDRIDAYDRGEISGRDYQQVKRSLQQK